MEELKILDDLKPTKKVYKKGGITLGAFLGGPIGAGYFLIENYKSLDKEAVVKKAWGITIFSTIAYYVLAYVFSEVIETTTIPLYVACLAGARQIFQQQQAADVEAYIQQGGEVYSNWRVIGISFIFLLGTIAVIGGLSMFFVLEEPPLPPPPIELVETPPTPRSTTSSRNNLTQSVVASLESKAYGAAAHVIIYNNFFFTESKIDSIAAELTALNFFDAENRKEIYIDKVLFDYEFSIVDVSADVNKEKTNLRYKELRANMEAFLKDGKVFILLKDENLENVLAQFGEEL